MTDKKIKKKVETLADHYSLLTDFIRNQSSLQTEELKQSFRSIQEANFIRATDQKISKLESKCTRYLSRIKQLEEENEALKAQIPTKETTRKRRRPQFHEEVWNNIEGGYQSDKNWTRGNCIHCDSEITHHRRLDRVQLHLQSCKDYRLAKPSEIAKGDSSDSDTD
jgi:chromosome segregation ATPase